MKAKPTKPANPVKFVHLRYLTPAGEADSFGGITVAARENGAGVEYALARCNRTDRYVKKIGRTKAQARLDASNREDAAFRRTLPSITLDAFIQAFYTHNVSIRDLLFKV